MSIMHVTTDFAGQVNVNPRLVRVNCNDNLAKVMSSGYLNGKGILETDFVCVSYSGGQAVFQPSINPSTGVVTLTAQTNLFISGSSVVNDLPKFSNTSGSLQDSGIPISNVQLKNNIKAGITAYAGGSTTFSLAVPGILSTSVVLANYNTSANSSIIRIISPSLNSISITATADPGISTISWIAFIAPQ